MKHWQKTFEAEKHGKRTIEFGFIGNTPYIHTRMLDSTGYAYAATTAFYPEWTWVNMGPDFSLYWKDDEA